MGALMCSGEVTFIRGFRLPTLYEASWRLSIPGWLIPPLRLIQGYVILGAHLPYPLPNDRAIDMPALLFG